MRLSRKTLLIILGVVVVGGAIYFVFNWDRVEERFGFGQTDNRNTSTNTTGGANLNRNLPSPNLNTSVPNEVKGDQKIDATASVAGVSLHFTSFQYGQTYNGITAGASKTLLVVFFDGIPSEKVAAVLQELPTRMTVTHAGGTVALRSDKVASSQVKNDRGYLLFEIPAKATNVALIGPAGVRIPIAAPK